MSFLEKFGIFSKNEAGCSGCSSGQSCGAGCGEKCAADGASCGDQHCTVYREDSSDGTKKYVPVPDYHKNKLCSQPLTKGEVSDMDKKERKENTPADESRRNFLRGAGLIAGSAALLGATGLAASGCSVSNEDGETCTTTTAKTKVVNDVEYLGECVCPVCGVTVPHPKGTPCRLIPCPKCGEGMGRLA
ncbi:MAG: twin-arginine translocation signal domain-containing protein [Dehalococcoidales bacterium]